MPTVNHTSTRAALLYRVYLRALVKRTYKELRKRLDLTDLVGRLDAAPHHPARKVTAAVDRTREIVRELTRPEKVRKQLDKVIKAGDDAQRTRLEKEIAISPRELKRGVSTQLDQFAAENVRLIRDVPGKFLDRCEKLLHDGFDAGERPSDLASKLRDEFGIADRRAQLIARDQSSKLVAGLNQVRQTNAGIKRYVWRTVNDERTRPLHAERDGMVFAWDEPPDETEDDGHPGEPINCRCYPEPMEDEDEETAPEETTPE